MQQFTYTIQDSLGIHARPAGLLVKEAKQYPDTALTLTKDGKSAKLNQLMRLLSLGVKQGDTVTLRPPRVLQRPKPPQLCRNSSKKTSNQSYGSRALCHSMGRGFVLSISPEESKETAPGFRGTRLCPAKPVCYAMPAQTCKSQSTQSAHFLAKWPPVAGHYNLATHYRLARPTFWCGFGYEAAP